MYIEYNHSENRSIQWTLTLILYQNSVLQYFSKSSQHESKWFFKKLVVFSGHVLSLVPTTSWCDSLNFSSKVRATYSLHYKKRVGNQIICRLFVRKKKLATKWWQKTLVKQSPKTNWSPTRRQWQLGKTGSNRSPTRQGIRVLSDSPFSIILETKFQTPSSRDLISFGD